MLYIQVLGKWVRPTNKIVKGLRGTQVGKKKKVLADSRHYRAKNCYAKIVSQTYPYDLSKKKILEGLDFKAYYIHPRNFQGSRKKTCSSQVPSCQYKKSISYLHGFFNVFFFYCQLGTSKSFFFILKNYLRWKLSTLKPSLSLIILLNSEKDDITFFYYFINKRR